MITKNLLSALVSTSAKDAFRPALCTVRFDPNGPHSLTITATDGHRAARVHVARHTHNITEPVSFCRFQLEEALKSFSAKTEVLPSYEGGVAQVRADGLAIECGVIEDRFPDVDRAAFNRFKGRREGFDYSGPAPAYDARYVKDAAEFMRKVTGKANAPFLITLGEDALSPVRFSTKRSDEDLFTVDYVLMPVRL